MQTGFVMDRDRGAGALALLLTGVALSLAGCGGGQGSAGPGKSIDVEREIEFAMRSAQKGLWNEALYRFERAVAVRPEDASLHNNLAVAYEHEGRYDDAAREYDRASEIAPGNDYIKRNVEAFRSFRAGKPVRSEDSELPEKPAEPPPAQASGGQPDVR